eukprot:4914041-Amphidinium_carterae.2
MKWSATAKEWLKRSMLFKPGQGNINIERWPDQHHKQGRPHWRMAFKPMQACVEHSIDVST